MVGGPREPSIVLLKSSVPGSPCPKSYPCHSWLALWPSCSLGHRFPTCTMGNGLPASLPMYRWALLPTLPQLSDFPALRCMSTKGSRPEPGWGPRPSALG